MPTVRNTVVTTATTAVLLMFGLVGTAAAGTPPNPEPPPGSYTITGGRAESHSRKPHSDVRTVAAPPPCVTAAQDPPGNITQTVHITNGCAAQQSVKVLVKYDFDSECFILNPGGTASYAVPLNPMGNTFDGLAAC